MDNLAEKDDKCPLNWGRQVMFAYVSVIRSSGVSLFMKY